MRVQRYSHTLLLRIVSPLTIILSALAPFQAHAAEDLFSIKYNSPFFVSNDELCAAGTGSQGAVALVGGDNVEKAYNFFVTKGLTPAQSAGLVGNLIAESGVNPNNSQDKKQDPTPINGVGFGIGQWTFTARQAPLVALAKQMGLPPIDLGVQLEYTWQELTTTYKGALDDLKKQTTAAAAATSVMIHYEAPRDHAVGGANDIKRTGLANGVLAKYGNGAPGGGAAGGSTSNTASCGSSGSVNCGSAQPSPSPSAAPQAGTPQPSPTPADSSGLSTLRRNVVCLTLQELAKWTPPPPIPRLGYYIYSQNRPEEWCADFVSWIYDQAKYPLRPDPNWNVALVQAIWDIGNQNQNFHFHGAGYTPRPGDIVIHKNGASHTNIVVEVSGNTVSMVGGDQGSGPYGGTNSASVVSKVTANGFISGDITGYVSPD